MRWWSLIANDSLVLVTQSKNTTSKTHIKRQISWEKLLRQSKTEQEQEEIREADSSILTSGNWAPNTRDKNKKLHIYQIHPTTYKTWQQSCANFWYLDVFLLKHWWHYQRKKVHITSKIIFENFWFLIKVLVTFGTRSICNTLCGLIIFKHAYQN